jgi:hypothetical protein
MYVCVCVYINMCVCECIYIYICVSMCVCVLCCVFEEIVCLMINKKNVRKKEFCECHRLVRICQNRYL